MYKMVNLKPKLFTKLTNQNSYGEARAIGCISNIILQDRGCQWSQVRKKTVLKCSCFFHQVLFHG